MLAITEWNRASTGLKTADAGCGIPDQFCVFNARPYRSFRHLPLLKAHGFRGDLYNGSDLRTYATICSGTVPTFSCWRRVEQEGKRHAGIEVEEPLYTMEDADGTINCRTCPMGKNWNKRNVTIRFTDVGHLLDPPASRYGSKKRAAAEKLVFSGGYRQQNQPLIKDPNIQKRQIMS